MTAWLIDIKIARPGAGPSIRRTGTSSGGRNGKPATYNTKAKGKGRARKI
jgi:hypothetical protein